MKKLVTALSCCLVLFSGLSQGERMSVGVHLHPGFSKFHSAWSYLSDYRFCYNAGIDFRYQFKETGLHLETGLGWNEYGYRVTVDLTDNVGNLIGELKTHETYFFASLPLNVTYKLANFTFSVGTMGSYYVMRKVVSTNSTSSPFYKTKTTDKALYADLHYAFNFKAGYEFELGDSWLLGVEAFSNWMPTTTYYNFGIGLSGRYKLGSSAH